MKSGEALRMNTTALAYLGDAVYEARVRRHILDGGVTHADRLHTAAVRYVNAAAQASVMKALMDISDEVSRADGGGAPESGTGVSREYPAGLILSDDERALIRRARNKKSASRPKNADPMDYKWATAFEALIGYYSLTGLEQKIETLIKFAIGHINRAPQRI